MIPEIDEIINLLENNKLNFYLLKIDKLNKDPKKIRKKQKIINYIELKIKQELLNREKYFKNLDLSKNITSKDIDEIIKNSNINKIFIKES
jgi:hypothetical protein